MNLLKAIRPWLINAGFTFEDQWQDVETNVLDELRDGIKLLLAIRATGNDNPLSSLSYRRRFIDKAVEIMFLKLRLHGQK